MRFKSANYVSIFLLLICSLFFHKAMSQDWQLWTDQKISARVHDNVTLTVKEEFHFDNNITRMNVHFSDFNITYAWTDWFKTSIRYRQLAHNTIGNNKWIQEYRPHFNAIFAWETKNFSFSNRHRLEFNHYSAIRPNSIRYRNIFGVTPDFSFSPLNIYPQIKDELWYNFHTSEIQFNHLYLGMSMHPNDLFYVQAYYIFATIHSSPELDSFNVMKITMGITMF